MKIGPVEVTLRIATGDGRMGWNRPEVRRLLLLPALLALPLVFASCGVAGLGGVIGGAVLAVTMLAGLVFLLLSSAACSCSSTRLGPCLTPAIDSYTDPDVDDDLPDIGPCLEFDADFDVCLSPPMDAWSDPDMVGPCLDILPDMIDPTDVEEEDADAESECLVGPCLTPPPDPGGFEGAALILDAGAGTSPSGGKNDPGRGEVIDRLAASGVIPARLARRMKRLRG